MDETHTIGECSSATRRRKEKKTKPSFLINNIEVLRNIIEFFIGYLKQDYTHLLSLDWIDRPSLFQSFLSETKKKKRILLLDHSKLHDYKTHYLFYSVSSDN